MGAYDAALDLLQLGGLQKKGCVGAFGVVIIDDTHIAARPGHRRRHTRCVTIGMLTPSFDDQCPHSSHLFTDQTFTHAHV